MKRLVHLATLISFALVLSGCTTNYKDISSEPGFSQYIGQSYTLKNDMSMHGINFPPGYSNKIDAYVMGKLYEVHHKAPEEVSFSIIPKGSTFNIIGVYECTNCLSFSKLRKLSITTKHFEKVVDAPVIIPMHEIESKENVELVR